MAVNREQVMEAIFKAIDIVNQGRAPAQRIPKATDTVLIGAGATVDSLGLVNLVVAVEEEVASSFGAAVNIADEQARAQASSPLRTVQSMADYIVARLPESHHG